MEEGTAVLSFGRAYPLSRPVSRSIGSYDGSSLSHSDQETSHQSKYGTEEVLLSVNEELTELWHMLRPQLTNALLLTMPAYVSIAMVGQLQQYTLFAAIALGQLVQFVYSA